MDIADGLQSIIGGREHLLIWRETARQVSPREQNEALH
jgi:hypothetical protein